MGSLRPTPFSQIKDLTFRVYTEEEIDKISVVNITNETAFNDLGHHLEKGIYDPHMGPMTPKDEECKTCGNKFIFCKGHFGHIDLPLLVCNPFFINVLKESLKRICPCCYRFQVKAHRGVQFVYESQLFFAGYALQALEVANIVSQTITNPDEAIEVQTSVDGADLSQSKDGALYSVICLEKKLKSMFKRLKKEEAPSKSVTCNSQSIFIQIQKNFLQDTIANKSVCIYCSQKLLQLKFQNSQILIKNWAQRSDNKEETEENVLDSCVSKSQHYLTPKQAQKILQECYKKDGFILNCLYPFMLKSNQKNPVDSFFIQKLLVTPPRYRPSIILNGIKVESEQSFIYKSVLHICKCLRFMVQYMDKDIDELPKALKYLLSEVPGTTMLQKSHKLWNHLQGAIDNIYDADISPNLKVAPRGIRQIIEKKMGLVRRNLMGKRVDYSARSVAAPDAVLAVDEVGVPKDFALKLTYPVPVTQWNVPYLRKLVQNGPSVYPGALMVENEEGRKNALKADDPVQRDAIARSLLTPLESCVRRVNATKIVYRHLQSGDYVLMNRQPTLHKPSIQAHRAKIMPNDRVIRLPYASCKAYNADFDGDELNLHFPQNEMARSEAHHLITSRNQYLTPKDGSPLAGLIQDCVVAAVALTVRGKFFSCEDYQQLVFVALGQISRKIRVLPPAILKPRKLWSGKQIISTILLNLIPRTKALPTFKFRTTVKAEMWQRHKPRMWKHAGRLIKQKEWMTESEFVMQDGELLCGVVDKCAIGSTSYGLVHTCFDLYGGMVASNLLTSISRLCIWFLQWSGHTISLKEFVTSPEAASRRRKDLKMLIKRTDGEVKLKLGLSQETSLAEHIEFLHKSENEKEMAVVDSIYTSILGPTTSSVTSENEKSLLRNNLENRMKMMVDTGAKGSKVNMNQMASLFGSVALDGKRMPMSITGKTLPSYKPYETNPTAGGYIPTRFVTGMDPKSYFFLCIVGRDSLQHTAVKTANSGYMQRCLIKHLEGIHVKYDMTVRNNDGVVLQFQYGEDGLDVSKVPFLKNVNTLDSLVDNYRRCLGKKDIEIATNLKLPKLQKYKKWVEKYKAKTKKGKRSSPFLRFSKACKSEVENPLSIDASVGRSENALKKIQEWRQLSQETKTFYQELEEKGRRGRDPIMSKYSAASSFGVVSEALDSLIDTYYEEKYLRRRAEEQTLTKEEISDTLCIKALHSQVDPGEAVGALCAQAIGEPLTQMTLNTFHFAGRDELNVTLGVPRMIEILRSASENIKTPIMEVPFKSHVVSSLAERLRIKLTPVILQKVINSVSICTSLEKDTKLYNHTNIQFNFLPHRNYKKAFFVRPSDILQFMEKTYIKKILIGSIKAALKKVAVSGVSFGSDRKLRREADDKEEEEEQASSQKRRLDEEKDDDDDDNEQQEDENQIVGVSSDSRTKKLKEMDYSEDEEEEDDIEKHVFGQEPLEEEEDEEGEEAKMDASQKKRNRMMTNNINDIITSEDEELGNEADLLALLMESEENENVENSFKKPTQKKDLPAVTEINVEDKDYVFRKNKVISQDPWILDYDFDRTNMLWCTVCLKLPFSEGQYDLATMLQETAKTTYVHSIKGIKKALVVAKEDSLLLRTEGVNIQALFAYENILNINRLYTNNIRLMANIYGIEAGQRCIIREIREVQSAYDIKVDFRHLTLLADYFTCEGVYKACSRHALATCASPIQMISYETSLAFLKKSLLQGLHDNMSSPSANIIVGQPIKIGTNSMNILSKLVATH